jgi:hypothetical protein
MRIVTENIGKGLARKQIWGLCPLIGLGNQAAPNLTLFQVLSLTQGRAALEGVLIPW